MSIIKKYIIFSALKYLTSVKRFLYNLYQIKCCKEAIMPGRNQIIVRRDINRLKEVIERGKAANPALSAISPAVTTACDNVNKA